MINDFGSLVDQAVAHANVDVSSEEGRSSGSKPNFRKGK